MPPPDPAGMRFASALSQDRRIDEAVSATLRRVTERRQAEERI